MGGTIYGMQKTTVYLSDEQVDALRRASFHSGKSKAELIREGVEAVTRNTPKRHFLSMGSGEGDGKPFDAEEYLREHWADDLMKRRGLSPS